jgi:hypothetical protein
MKANNQEALNLAPQQEREILEQIRNDHELLARLKITPAELESLEKCALWGTLTSKQDMLFILRQIREATNAGGDQAILIHQPAAPENEEEEEDDKPLPDFRRMPLRSAPAISHDPASLESIVRRRMPEQFGVLFWVLVLVLGVVWNGATAILRWRDNFMAATVGAPVEQASSSPAWYANFDRFNVLAFWEIVFVLAIAGAIYLHSRRGTRHLKVRPSRRYR